MAIKIKSKAEDNEIKVDFDEAYLKVYDVEIRVAKEEAWIRINIFGSKDARETDGVCSIKKITERVSLDELKPKKITKDGLITAAYEWIKKQKQYKGIDI